MKRTLLLQPAKHRGGVTLLEVMLTILVLGSATFGVVTSIQRGLELFRESGARMEVRTRAGRAVDRVARELVGASFGSLQPPLDTIVGLPDPWTDDLRFRRADSWAGAVVLGLPRRFELVLTPGEVDDGLDNNGNGLIDERDLALVVDDGLPAERRVVLTTGATAFLAGEVPNGLDDNGNGLVDERGFCVTREGRTLTVRISTQRIGQHGETTVMTEEIAVAIRND